LVAASLLLLAVTFILTDLQHARSRLEESATRMLQLINIQNAVALRRALETGDEDTLQGLVSGIALDDQVDWVALTDIDNTVRASSHYAWLERNLNRLIHNPASLPTIPRGSTLQVDADGPYMLSIKPIQYRPRQHPDDKDTAILWVHLDRSNSIQALHHELRNAALLWLAGTLGLILILTWLLRRFVTTPLTHLEAAARQIAAGDLDVRLNIHGRGDVADLAHSMQHMAQRIAQASTALRQSEQRLSITLDSIGDAVLVTDLQGLVTRMNPVAEQMTGWKTQEAQGHPVIEVFHIVNALTREPAEHPVGRVLREGVVVGLANHTTLISRDGTEYQIADSAAPIVDEDGQTLGVVMVFQDVTLRYAAEREISATKERLQAILSSLPDPCFVLDGNGTYVDILGGREELLAASREALLGRRVQDVLSPEQAAPIMRVVEETLDSGRPGHLEYEIDTPGGIRFFEGNTAPLHDADRPLVIWLARDHTERRLAEEQLQQLARFDQLTGLANRATTTEHLQALLLPTGATSTLAR
jgi:PAS domain S-box-containing protein